MHIRFGTFSHQPTPIEILNYYARSDTQQETFLVYVYIFPLHTIVDT